MQQQRKGHKNGVDTLMHLPKGQTSDWNPCPHIRMLHAKACASLNSGQGVPLLGLFPCFLNRTIPEEISEVFSVSAK